MEPAKAAPIPERNRQGYQVLTPFEKLGYSLYFLSERDEAYVDLVELEDSFEFNPGVKRGALVEARSGDGRWLYVGLGLWRQLPVGTTGAYELLANLLSLGAER